MDMSISPLGLHPNSRWHRVAHLCEKVEVEDGEMLTISIGGNNNKWGEWKCPVGTVSIGDLTPCIPCQKIEYTCRDTGARVFKKTVCPLGAKYPDRRLNLMGDELPAEGSEEDEIKVPKKTCPQIKQETIRFIFALWKKDCDIKTDGELKDLLKEAGPHCGAVRYSCPTTKGQPQRKEWNYCARQIGTWERSMRQFLMGLSPTCTVEGDGKTALWWKYYHDILIKRDTEAVYGFGVTRGKEKDELVTDETILHEYQRQKKKRKIYHKPPGLMSVAQPVFYRNNTLSAWSNSWSQQTVGGALSALCSSVTIQGEYSEYTDDAEENWFEAAADHAMGVLVCPAPELSR